MSLYDKLNEVLRVLKDTEEYSKNLENKKLEYEEDTKVKDFKEKQKQKQFKMNYMNLGGFKMNFYDKVHEMVRALKDSEEYKKYVEMKKIVSENVDKKDTLKEFKEKQREAQMIYINTGKPAEDMQKDLENLYSLLIQDENIRKMFESEMKLDIMLADMQKIVAEGIKDIIEMD